MSRGQTKIKVLLLHSSASEMRTTWLKAQVARKLKEQQMISPCWRFGEALVRLSDSSVSVRRRSSHSQR